MQRVHFMVHNRPNCFVIHLAKAADIHSAVVTPIQCIILVDAHLAFNKLLFWKIVLFFESFIPDLHGNISYLKIEKYLTVTCNFIFNIFNIFKISFWENTIAKENSKFNKLLIQKTKIEIKKKKKKIEDKHTQIVKSY